MNVGNIKNIIPELLQENLVRGRGLFCRAVMKAQLASPGFTHIYSALVAVINTKMPELGELLLKRVVVQFRRAYKRNDKVRVPCAAAAAAAASTPALTPRCQIVATALAKFVAHLVNQQVAHEVVALQLLTVLLESPTDDSVEVAVNFVKESGQMLGELSPAGLHGARACCGRVGGRGRGRGRGRGCRRRC